MTHREPMLADATKALPAQPDAPGADAVTDGEARLRSVVRAHYQFLWRSLRRLGIREGDCDDAAQRVLSVLARRLNDVEAGREAAFLFQTALRVASELRRVKARSRLALDEVAITRAADPAPGADDAIDRKQARALLDEALDAMDVDLRAVFVLFELEEMSTPEVAGLLGIPAGTASSRLRRARDEFKTIAARLRARRTFEGRNR